MEIICKNCRRCFEGRYCNACGEKVVEEDDFKFVNMLKQAVGSITNLDSKLIRTFTALLFKPGLLAKEYVEGLRAPYMKPFQIFVVANLLFFLLLSEIDIFRSPSNWFFVENFDGIHVMEKVRSIEVTHDISVNEIARRYDKKSSDLAKGLLILIIPFIALICNLLFVNKKMSFGKHIVHVTIYFSFFLFACVILSFIAQACNFRINKLFVLIPVVVYFALSNKKFYQDNWIYTILKSVLALVLVDQIFNLYRMGVSVITLYTI